jgi:hypothetical protein
LNAQAQSMQCRLAFAVGLLCLVVLAPALSQRRESSSHVALRQKEEGVVSAPLAFLQYGLQQQQFGQWGAAAMQPGPMGFLAQMAAPPTPGFNQPTMQGPFVAVQMAQQQPQQMPQEEAMEMRRGEELMGEESQLKGQEARLSEEMTLVQQRMGQVDMMERAGAAQQQQQQQQQQWQGQNPMEMPRQSFFQSGFPSPQAAFAQQEVQQGMAWHFPGPQMGLPQVQPPVQVVGPGMAVQSTQMQPVPLEYASAAMPIMAQLPPPQYAPQQWPQQQMVR